jgi:hypothetical protein
MRSFLRRKLTQLCGCTSGNAVMMTAMGLPALIGAAGYGADTAQWYMWQRELQHSVDQAAIGGAWSFVYGEDAEYQTRAQQEFFSNLQITDGRINGGAPQVSLANFDGGVGNSVLVRASITRRLPFTGMLMNRSATISAIAQAAFEQGGTFNACLMTLKDTGTTFSVGGNAEIEANCGLGALSCDDDAISITGSAQITTTSIVTCGTVNVETGQNLQSVITEGVEGSDDYADLPIPQPDGSTPNRTYACSQNGSNGSATLNPGRYAGISISCATTFNPGVYFIEGGVLDLTHNAPVVGTNVLFVLRNGAQLKLSGMGNAAAVTLAPMEAAQFAGTPYAADADLLSRMLFIEDKTGVAEPVDHQINGNADLNLSGIFYLPNGNVQINGNAEAANTCFQISAWTLDILGNAYLKTLCDASSSTQFGTGATGVRLIA